MPNTITVRKLNKLEDGVTVFPITLSQEFIFNTKGYLAGFVVNSREKGCSFGPPDSPNHALVKKHYPKSYKIIKKYHEFWENNPVSTINKR